MKKNKKSDSVQDVLIAMLSGNSFLLNGETYDLVATKDIKIKHSPIKKRSKMRTKEEEELEN